MINKASTSNTTEWSRPKLERLGKIEDVKGGSGSGAQSSQQLRS